MLPAARCRKVFLVVVVLSLGGATAPTPAGNVYWMNTSGGNWSNPANWSPQMVPGPGDTASIIFSTGSPYSVTLDVDVTVDVLSVNNAGVTVSAVGRTITVNGSAMIGSGTVILRDSTWTGSATVQTSATLIAQRSSTFTVPIQVTPTGDFIVETFGTPSTRVTAEQGIVNHGEVIVRTSGYETITSTLAIPLPALLDNESDGTVRFAGGSLKEAGLRRIEAVLENEGLVSIEAYGASYLHNPSSQPHVNRGQILVPGAGTGNGEKKLRFTSAIPGSTVFINEGTIDCEANYWSCILEEEAQIVNAGAIRDVVFVSNSTVEIQTAPGGPPTDLKINLLDSVVRFAAGAQPSGVIYVTGNSTLEFEDPANARIPAGLTISANTSFLFSDYDTSLEYNGGDLVNEGELVVATGTVRDATLRINGILTNELGAILRLSALIEESPSPLLDATVINHGIVLVNEGVWLGPEGGQHVNSETGFMLFHNHLTMKDPLGTRSFINQGYIELQGQGGRLILPAFADNRGEVVLFDRAEIVVVSGCLFTNQEYATINHFFTGTPNPAIDYSFLRVQPGGRFLGLGVVNARVAHDGGTISPGLPTLESTGELRFKWDYSQKNGATLAIAVRGLGQGTGYDWIPVETDVELLGGLSVRTDPAFNPCPGDFFKILTWNGERTHAFDGGYTGLLASNGYNYIPVFDDILKEFRLKVSSTAQRVCEKGYSCR